MTVGSMHVGSPVPPTRNDPVESEDNNKGVVNSPFAKGVDAVGGRGISSFKSFTVHYSLLTANRGIYEKHI